MPELCVVSSTIHMHKVKYKILDETCQIVWTKSYKYGNHKYKLLYIKLENLDVYIQLSS